MTKILVTGSRGFIGSQIVKRLENYEIIPDSVNSKQIDLSKIDEVMKLKDSDVVIHLGAKTTKNLTRNEYFDNNVLGTLNVLEYCIKKNIKKIIFVSSYIYGKPKYIPIDEEHPISPHNSYTNSKYLAEQLCKLYAKNFKLNIIILRPFNIFGKTLPSGFLISNLISSLEGKKKVVIVNRNSRRDFLHIDDFVDVILKFIEYDCKFEIFNLGSGKTYSFNEIIEKIEKISNKKLKLEFKEDKENFIKEITADISKIRKKIKWSPKISFEEGLQRYFTKR